VKTVVIVAKGPSALQASKVIGAGESIAVINDSGKLIPDMHIDYFFFAHHTVFENMKHLRGRFNQAISRTLNAHQLGWMPDWIRERHIMLEDLDCDGDLHSLHHRLLYGGIMAHHTTTLAMHYLCKHAKYEKIKVIGVDGGVAYAESLERTPSLPADLDLFMQIAKRVAEICHNVYGTKFEWYQYEGGHTG
jgi:hypothetical protein